MNNRDNTSSFELIYIVVNYGMASKVLNVAKEYGVHGGTIFLGKGTVNNAFLNFLSLYEERREILLIGADKMTADHTLDMLNREFEFEKPNNGIIFTTSIRNIKGSSSYKFEDIKERGVKNSMYQLIITIVNRGKAQEVIDSAIAAGSKGGTIVNARGSGIHETNKVFNMNIEPEKEMVMIVSKEESTEAIVNSISKELEIDKPGNGVIFIQDVNRTYGVYE